MVASATTNVWFTAFAVLVKMASTVTSRADDSQLFTLSGSELGTHWLQSNQLCAVDYAWIVPDEAASTSTDACVTDSVLSLLLDVQRLAERLASIRRRRAAMHHC